LLAAIRFAGALAARDGGVPGAAYRRQANARRRVGGDKRKVFGFAGEKLMRVDKASHVIRHESKMTDDA